jgi:uncharacterized protein (DUF2164 family)
MKKFTVEIASIGAELQDCATEQEAEALIKQFQQEDILEFGESEAEEMGDYFYAIKVTDGDEEYMTTDLCHVREVTA